MATKDDYQEIKEIIRANKENNKKILSQRKNRKFNITVLNTMQAEGHSTKRINEMRSLKDQSHPSAITLKIETVNNSIKQDKLITSIKTTKYTKLGSQWNKDIVQPTKLENHLRKEIAQQEENLQNHMWKYLRGSIVNSNRRKANVHFQRQDDVQEIFQGQSDAEFTSRADPKNYNTASVIRKGTNLFLMHAME